MKRYLIFAALITITAWGFVGCKGDNGTTSELQTETPAPGFTEAPVEEPPETPDTETDTPAPDAQSTTGLCYANNFKGERFQVISYKDPIITANIVPTDCTLTHSRLKGEIRRIGTRGIREFVGDVRAIHGDRIRIYMGKLPDLCRPKKGETLKLIWKARKRRG